MSEPEYDEATCITAAELRAAGLPILNTIPDVAWVPRAAVRVLPSTIKSVFDASDKRITVSMGVEFTEPFRWVVINATIED